tara:strand:- start:262 stop:387 length:126 start_codon:yes stop_codon:yes gene_type:complete
MMVYFELKISRTCGFVLISAKWRKGPMIDAKNCKAKNFDLI